MPVTVNSGRTCSPGLDSRDQLLAQGDELRLSELHLKADDPSGKAKALAQILGAERDGASVEVGDTVVRFVRGGPQGRPELFGELFV